MFLGLRLMDGINLKAISNKYGVDVEILYHEALSKSFQQVI